MRKQFRRIHLWLAVPFGLIITIICFTGASLVFEQEIMEISRPNVYFVEEVGKQTISVDNLIEEVEAVIPDSVKVTGVRISSNASRCYEVLLSQPKHASIFINQYDGHITGENERAPFFKFMFRLHRWLLDSAKNAKGDISLGKLIVGISVIAFAFIIISGIVIWIPRSYTALKNRLKITSSKGYKRLLFDLHVSTSIYVCIILLMLALTGLTWSFSWYKNGFYKLFGAETTQPAKSNQQQAKVQKNESMYAVWDSVYGELIKKDPQYRQITISKGKALLAHKHIGNQRAADIYKFNPQTGDIESMQKYQQTDMANKLPGLIYALHTGEWGGIISKILTFIVAIVGCSLPLTGYFIWLTSVRNKMKRKRARMTQEPKQ